MPENKSEQPSASSVNVSDEENASKTIKGKAEPSQNTMSKTVEVGGRDGPDPVRYGDWEKGGRCIDF